MESARLVEAIEKVYEIETKIDKVYESMESLSNRLTELERIQTTEIADEPT